MFVVISSSYSGFKLKESVQKACADLGLKVSEWGYLEDGRPVERHDTRLKEAVIKVMFSKNSDDANDLHLVNIPNGINYKILEYDGVETIVEVGHYWQPGY